MLILLFLALIGYGVYELYQTRKQQYRTQKMLEISFGSDISPDKLEGQMMKYGLSQMAAETTSDFVYHFKGSNKSSFIKHLIIIAVVAAAVYAFNVTSLNMNNSIIMPIVIVLTCYFIFVASKKRARVNFEETFAEAISIIGSAVSVGNTVISGIEECGDKLAGTLVGEVFKNASKRLEIGEDIESVLMGSYKKLPYREYYFFIIAIVINMKGGGQLKEIMSRLGQIISNGRIMDRKKYAKTSEARMSVKTLACIPVFMFFMIKIISPENFEALTEDPVGHVILGYIVASTLLGLAIIWSMMNKV